jgi:hypothetical protein
MIAGRFARKGLAIFSAVVLTGAYVCHQGGILRLPRGWAGATPRADAGRRSVAAPTTMSAEGNQDDWSKASWNTEHFAVSPTQDAKSATLAGGTSTGPITIRATQPLKRTTMMYSSKSGQILKPDDVAVPYYEPDIMTGSKSGPILRPEDVRLADPQPLTNGVVVLQKPLVLTVTPATQPAN